MPGRLLADLDNSWELSPDCDVSEFLRVSWRSQSPAIPDDAYSMNITKMNLHGLSYAPQCHDLDEQNESR
jgi:hypothetical protein